MILGGLCCLLVLCFARVEALPQYYAEKGICTLPVRAFAAHKSPIADPDVTFTVMNGTAAAATWVPGGTYDVVVAYPAPVNMWIMSSTGAFTAPNLACADGATYTTATTMSQTVQWTAPACCKGLNASVTIGANVAKGQTDSYRQNTLAVPGDVTSCATATTDCAAPLNVVAAAPVTAASPDAVAASPGPSSSPAPSPATGGATAALTSAAALLALAVLAAQMA